MCNWQNTVIKQAGGSRRIPIDAQVIQDACTIIYRQAQTGEPIIYTDLMNQLKQLGYRKINRGTIDGIVGEVSNQVSQLTNPSVYPSAIVVRGGSNQPGPGFWGLNSGTNPPNRVTQNQRRIQLDQHQQHVFNLNWACNC